MSKLSPAANFLCDVLEEYNRSNALYPQFHSNHEGLAVLEEEVHEFREMVYKNKGLTPTDEMRKELVQIAAMALKNAVRL